LCTLEEYYTGGLFLGPGNGVSDGSVAIFSLFIIMTFTGNHFWVLSIVGSFRIVDLFMFFVQAGNIGLHMHCIKCIFAHQKKLLGPNDITGEPLVVKLLIIQLFGYLLPIVLLSVLT